MKTENQYLQLDTENLIPSSYALQVYGKEEVDEALVDSIEKIGQLEPLVVTEGSGVKGDFVIISGYRRWLALKKLGRKAICRLVYFKNELEMKEAIIEYNYQRKKSILQIYNEIKLLDSIYTEKEKISKKTTLKQNAYMMNSVQKEQNKEEYIRTRDKAANVAGIRQDKLEKLIEIKEKADAGNDHAKSLMNILDKDGLTIDDAYCSLKLVEVAESDDQNKEYARKLLDQVHRGEVAPKKAISRLTNQKKINDKGDNN
jgi:ParB-like chromosome segregation protein Spo0J